MYVPDNYDAWARHQDQQERELLKYPVCDDCGHRIIADYAYNINGDLICEDCLERDYKVEIPVDGDDYE